MNQPVSCIFCGMGIHWMNGSLPLYLQYCPSCYEFYGLYASHS